MKFLGGRGLLDEKDVDKNSHAKEEE